MGFFLRTVLSVLAEEIRRHPRGCLLVFGVLLAAALAVGVGLYIGSSVTDKACETAICCKDCSVITVSRIIDGDTFDSPTERVRLYGVDTPERGERCFTEAMDRLRELAGGSVRTETGPRLRDPFGRSLYYVYTRSGESIDEKLVREGFGLAWTTDGQHRDLLVRLEQEAQQESVGCLW